MSSTKTEIQKAFPRRRFFLFLMHILLRMSLIGRKCYDGMGGATRTPVFLLVIKEVQDLSEKGKRNWKSSWK